MKKMKKVFTPEQKAKKKQRKKKLLRVTAVSLLVALLSAGLFTAVKYYFDHDSISLNDTPAQSEIWFRQSANDTTLKEDGLFKKASHDEYNVFQQASLPIGAGDLGASIFGETDVDRLVINEKTLWTGGPSDSRPDYSYGNVLGADKNGKTKSDYYYQIRDLLLKGNNKAADALFNNLMGDPDGYGSYQCFGDIYLGFGHGNVSDYIRKLDVDQSVASLSYGYNGTNYTREYIASNPDKVIAIYLTADTVGKLDFTAAFPSKHGAAPILDGNSITIKGALSDNGMLYYGKLTVTTDGIVSPRLDGKLNISGASHAVIYVSAATDYKQEFPLYRTGETLDEVAARVDARIENAVVKGYDRVRADHIADYKSLYDRVKLDLGGVKSSLATDKLLKKYKSILLKSAERKYLEQTLFNYGRYLLISSSRADSVLPANLQGIWNISNTPPWSSDYHININLQMNYWAAYSTNLIETADPLVEFIKALREPGRIAAKNYTGTAEEAALDLALEYYGFTANTEINPFGFTGTREASDYSYSLWSPGSVAWLVHTIYEGYRYSMDTDYLADIYPVMREALRYFERTLVEDSSGKLVSAPTYSPEHGPITFGNTYEQSLIWQLYTDTVSAAETLGEDLASVPGWKNTLSRLRTVEVGKMGQIKEWYDEDYLFLRGEFHHRHLSHLLGLFPGDLINKDTNPEWIKAAKISLYSRGDKSTGWAMGQRINTWARLGDGNHSYKMIQQLLKTGIYPNLWDAHPPFQIDGNFGYVSGVSEMLVQSNLGYIELLPAIPSMWAKGRVDGLSARGGFQISAAWSSSKITRASVLSTVGGVCSVKLQNPGQYRVTTADGAPVPYTLTNDGKLVFDTVAGQSYVIARA